MSVTPFDPPTKSTAVIVTMFEVNWVINFPENHRKPYTCTLTTIPMSLPDVFVGRDKNAFIFSRAKGRLLVTTPHPNSFILFRKKYFPTTLHNDGPQHKTEPNDDVIKWKNFPRNNRLYVARIHHRWIVVPTLCGWNIQVSPTSRQVSWMFLGTWAQSSQAWPADKSLFYSAPKRYFTIHARPQVKKSR